MTSLTKSFVAALFCISSASAQTDIQAQLEAAVAQPNVAAMAALTIDHGQIKSQHYAGVRAAGGNERVGKDDVWNIGSNGKAMTATMVARLVEQGHLRWEATLEQMLPEVDMHPGYRTATLSDLLTHRAGLAENPDENWINSLYDDPRPLQAQRQEYLHKALAMTPVGPVHQDFSYSNAGPIIAAIIAEQRLGRPYEALMQELVFAPLAMTVGFGATVPGQNAGHDAGKPIYGPHAANPLVMAATGEMHMSLADWARFATDQMAGEHGRGKLLKAESYRYLHSAQGQTSSAHGWGVKQDFPVERPIRLLTHGGSNGYWFALITLAPEQEQAVLLVANSAEPTAAQAEMQLLKALVSEFSH